MHLEIKKTMDEQKLEQVLNIRKKVFIKEQKVPVDIEIDGLDDESEHFIAKLNGKTIGCARVRTFNNYVKLERIAVLKEHRGKGYGKQITNFLIDYYKKKDTDEIRLHSQISVADFYKKLGFKKRGEIFLEAEIEHVEMYMKN
jgi:predicted GNAT family N-acyltransferase